MSERDATQASEDSAGSARSATQWRQLHASLWAGRMNNRPVGTIEQGFGFVFVDLDGNRHAGYSTLEDAKDAANGPLPLPSSPASRTHAVRLDHFLVATVVVLVVLVTVWAVLRY